MKYLPPALLLLSLFCSATLLARKPVDGQIYWFEFKDKGSAHKIHLSPQPSLSPKAIERRRKFGIPIADDDLPVNQDYLNQLRQQGAVVVGASRWLNGALASIDDTLAVERIDGLPFVKREKERKPEPKRAKPFKPVDCKKERIPIALVEDVDTLYGEASRPVSMLQGDRLHRNGLWGNGITIAVIDEGFYGADVHPAFDSLRLSGRLLGYKDFTGRPSSFFSYERYDHGTKVLSCLAANRQGVLMGMAPEASYWLLSSEYSPEESPLEEYYWVFATEFADSVGVDIISSSLGYFRFDDSRGNYSCNDFYKHRSPASKAAACAWQKGIVVVASAGNEGQGSWRYLLFPGETPEIITVGSIGKEGKVSDFSSRGYRKKSIIKPDFVAPGEQICLTDGEDSYLFQDGTSFSAPLVSGLIACCLQANASLTNNEIKRLLIETATLSGKPNRCYGYGMPNFGKMIERIGIPSLRACEAIHDTILQY